MINITIGDDQLLLSESLAKILDSREEFSVVSIAKNGIEILKHCEEYKPDIVLLDIKMPLMDGIETLKEIKSKYKDIKVIILTTFDDEDTIMQALSLGVDGYVTKDLSPDQLFSSIQCVYSGLNVLTNSAISIIKEFSNMTSYKPNLDELGINEEEIKLIVGVVEGKSNKELSKELFLGEGTIKNKLSKIYKKLDVNDRVALAVFALENGIIE